MPLTDEQVIELTAIKVQEIVCPKVEAFTDGVASEVHKIHLELKDSREFTSSIIAQLNDVRGDVAKLEKMGVQLTELYTLFCKNGYMKRFNELAAAVQSFFRSRLDTCPLAQDMRAIKKELEARRVEALERAEGKLRTRAEDDRRAAEQRVAATRWRIATLISLAALAVTILTGIVGKLRGWW